jgi:hypothetical protein
MKDEKENKPEPPHFALRQWVVVGTTVRLHRHRIPEAAPKLDLCCGKEKQAAGSQRITG